MKEFIDYSIVFVCGFAILLEFLRIVKLLFDPWFLHATVFDYPINKLRLLLLSVSGILVMLYTIIRKLEFL